MSKNIVVPDDFPQYESEEERLNQYQAFLNILAMFGVNPNQPWEKAQAESIRAAENEYGRYDELVVKQ